MTKKIKAVLRGMGSVFDLSPPPSALRFMPQGSDTERLRADFERIGGDMCHVFGDLTAKTHAPPQMGEGGSGRPNLRSA